MINLKILIISVLLGLALIPFTKVYAQLTDSTTSGTVSFEQAPSDEFFRAKVLKIIKEEERDLAGFKQWYQLVEVLFLDGKEKDQRKEVEHNRALSVADSQRVGIGETVVMTKVGFIGGDTYYIIDKYRISPLVLIGAIFLGLVIFFGRLKGFNSILGLTFSLLIIIKFIIPNILSGQNPLIISLIGAVLIALISLYLAHGFNKRTTIALFSTLITLGIAALLAMIFVSLSKLTGVGTEEAYSLKLGPLENINLHGLLLGGIIIGCLGVLDDITTSQVAAVDEIYKANSSFSFQDLYQRGISVGKEHIASLVNTLALAYVGASFPLLLVFSLYSSQPLWVTINSEFLVEEVIRTLVGSSALIFAVPISTSLAAYFLTSKRKFISSKTLIFKT